MYWRLRKYKLLKVNWSTHSYVSLKNKQSVIVIILMLLVSTGKDLYGCGGDPPTANFSVDNAAPVVGQSIKFTDTSTNGPTGWSWNFGSGASPGTANTQGPHNVLYTTTGSKNVSLTASNSDGSDTETKNNYINVSATPVPTAGNNGPVCEGSTLSLTASTISGATYSWTGPNGFTSSAQNPTVSISATTAMAGTYSVNATLYGYPGASGTTTVTVNSLPTFTTTKNDISCFNANNGSITITVTGGGTYSYSINNGSTYPYSGASPYTITPLGPGTYTVRVKNSNQCVSACP